MRLPARVTIVSVTHNSCEVLPKMLASVPGRVPVVIVDNGSEDVGYLRLVAKREDTKLILNEKNYGFGVACNQGAAASDTEFLFFLNPDACLKGGTLEKLIAGADRHKGASAFGPSEMKKSGKRPLKRSSVLLPRRKWLRGIESGTDTIVPVLSGAALLVRRRVFNEIGGFDPGIFLYHEDDDLGLRLREKVGPLFYIPDAEVCHIVGGSSLRSPEAAEFKAWHMGRSRVYSTRKHNRPMPFSNALLSALLQLVSPLVFLSKRKRAKQLSFLKGVWSSRTLPDTVG